MTNPGYRIVKSSPKDASRRITAAEVKEWFGDSRQAQLCESQYYRIATRLTNFHWPGDPPAHPDSPWLPKVITEPDDDRRWDFRAVTDAAKLLRDSMSKMLAFQEGLRPTSQTRGGYRAIKTLQVALLAALPYIEWPFGQYERQTAYKEPKKWHTYAFLVALVTIDEMINAGHIEPGITRNSVVVRVVQKALIRMGIPQSKTLSNTAIGAFLTRWNERYGLTPKGIAALTTKQGGAPL